MKTIRKKVRGKQIFISALCLLLYLPVFVFSQNLPFEEDNFFSTSTELDLTNDLTNKETNGFLVSNQNLKSGKTDGLTDLFSANKHDGPETFFSGQLDFKNFLNLTENPDQINQEERFLKTIGAKFDLGLNLDVRLNRGVKAKTSILIQYDPAGEEDLFARLVKNMLLDDTNFQSSIAAQGLSTSQIENALTRRIYFDFLLSEMFIDVNISRKVYWRFGKQMIKWGPGYFWNPGDLITVDSKTFTDLDRVREGTLGAKVHVPIKTIFNFYGFMNISSVTNAADYTYSLKTEFLIGRVEASLAAWFAAEEKPVVSLGATTGVRGWNIYGEGVLFQESFESFWQKKTVSGIDTYILDKKNDPFFRVTTGINRSFHDEKGYIGFEFYYNGSGYTGKILKKDDVRSGIMRSQEGYTPFSFNRFYGALFLSYNELFKNTTTLSLNTAFNAEDGSGVISGGIHFSPVNYFYVDLSPNLYFGVDSRREWTFLNQFFDVSLNIGVTF